MSDDRIYPCNRCGVMRSKDEGGTVFTVCDDCWEKTMPLPAVVDETARLRAEVERLARERDEWKECAARTGTERRSDEMAAIHEADSLRAKLAAAEKERDEWRDTCQAISDLFDPLHHEAQPYSALMVARAAKEAHSSVRDDRDRLAAELQAVREELEVVREAMRQAQETATRRLADCERMRAVYEVAVRWLDGRHTGDANCSAGDCDDCEARTLEGLLRVRIAESLGREPDRWDCAGQASTPHSPQRRTGDEAKNRNARPLCEDGPP